MDLDLSKYGKGQKKRRAPNFSDSEKKLFLRILVNYKDIVENKKSDAVTKEEKNTAWSDLTEEFNQTTALHLRTEDSLKTLWDNLKKGARKSKAEEKKEIFKTGGGPRDPAIGPTADEEQILEILGPSGEGLSDNYGGDRVTMDDAENIYPLGYGSQFMTPIDDQPVLAEEVVWDIDVTSTPLSPIQRQNNVIVINPSESDKNVAKSWTANHASKMLMTPKALPLKPDKRPSPATPQLAFDEARTDLAVATKNELIIENKRKAEMHKHAVKKLKLEILKLKKELGVVQDEEIREFCEKEGL